MSHALFRNKRILSDVSGFCLAGLCLLLLAGCYSNTRYFGGKISQDVFAQLPQPMYRQEVVDLFGQPMLTGAFTDKRLIYVHEKRQWGFFFFETVTDRMITVFEVDDKDLVVTRQQIRQRGADLPKRFQHSAATDAGTVKRPLLLELFGNIGASGGADARGR